MNRAIFDELNPMASPPLTSVVPPEVDVDFTDQAVGAFGHDEFSEGFQAAHLRPDSTASMVARHAYAEGPVEILRAAGVHLWRVPTGFRIS